MKKEINKDIDTETAQLKEVNKKLRKKLNLIRAAFADYAWSEGCSCCQNPEQHDIAADKLGELLDFTRYEDGSGWDFYKFRTADTEQ